MGKARIFIVEDEIVIVRGLEEAVKSLGYKSCGFAFSGEEALERIEKQKPDVVLADIHLDGDMDGIELARRITSLHRIPVIYITAYSDREVLDRAKITDPSGYIVKPVRDSQLKVNIELALERCKREKERNAALEVYLRTIEELRDELDGRNRRLDESGNALERVTGERDRHQAKLNELRWELQEVNKSLLNVTGHMARMREEMEMEVAVAVRTRIMPILTHLQGDPAFQPYRIELDMLGMYMDLLWSSIRKDEDGAGAEALSTTELRVAALIKNNLTTDEIADRLFISPETVKTHRRNIRKKLGIHNTSENLVAYLKTKVTCHRLH